MIVKVGHNGVAQLPAAEPVVHLPVGVRQVPDRFDVRAPDLAQAVSGRARLRAGW